MVRVVGAVYSSKRQRQALTLAFLPGENCCERTLVTVPGGSVNGIYPPEIP